jgi:hypothetical protein
VVRGRGELHEVGAESFGARWDAAWARILRRIVS